MFRNTPLTSRRAFLQKLAFAPAALACPVIARAHGSAADASAASSLSLSLPVAVLLSAPVAFLVAGTVLTVTAIEASAAGTVWVVRRTSDAVTASLRVSSELAAASVVAVGSTLAVTAIAAGWLLSLAGEVICLVPSAIGESLLYNERVR